MFQVVELIRPGSTTGRDGVPAQSTSTAAPCFLALSKRGNLQQVLLSPRPFPVKEEFLLVDCRPFNHESQHARRQATREDGQVANFDQSNVATVLRMEMRWIVIIKEHLDDDAEETADLRPRQSHGAGRGKCPPAVCPLL